MIAIQFVMSSGHAALVDATGLAAAHLFIFFSEIYPNSGGPRLLQRPRWLSQLVGNQIWSESFDQQRNAATQVKNNFEGGGRRLG